MVTNHLLTAAHIEEPESGFFDGESGSILAVASWGYQRRGSNIGVRHFAQQKLGIEE
jgi:hypothetical protein